MKTRGILHSDVARVVASVGHGDMIAITDRGFPFPSHDRTARIDVSVGRDLPRVGDVLRVVLQELEVESVIIARETKERSPQAFQEFQEILSSKRNKGNPIEQKIVPHAEFKHLVLYGGVEGSEVKAMIKTGQCMAYVNIILVAGVDF